MFPLYGMLHNSDNRFDRIHYNVDHSLEAIIRPLARSLRRLRVPITRLRPLISSSGTRYFDLKNKSDLLSPMASLTADMSANLSLDPR